MKLQSPTPNALALTHPILFRYNDASVHAQHPGIRTISISTCYYCTRVMRHVGIYARVSYTSYTVTLFGIQGIGLYTGDNEHNVCGKVYAIGWEASPVHRP